MWWHRSPKAALGDLFRVIGGAAAGDPQRSHRVHELPDPVGAGFVDSLARSGGNATGFVVFEFRLAGKWLELLKLIAPNVTRAAVIRDPAISAGIGQWGAIQTAAPSFGVEVSPINVRDAGEIERAVAVFALSSNRGLILATSPAAYVHHNLIVTLAARHKLPAIYFARFAGGGLMSYGPELVINLKTAKALGAPRATDADRTHRRDDRVAVRRMSPMGHSRRFDRRPVTSGLPRLAEILRVRRHVSKVPTTEVAPLFTSSPRLRTWLR
jgi:hypothetical protein